MAENRKIDLRTLKIGKAEDPKRRRVKVTLPASKKEAIISVLSAQGAVKVGRLRPTQKDIKSLALLARLTSYDGVTLNDPRLGLAQIKDSSQKDRNYIRQVYNLMEEHVETDIEVDCRNQLCGASWKFPLDVGQHFFLDLEGKVSDADLKWL